MAFKLSEFKDARDEIDEVIAFLERNARENKDFAQLSTDLKAGDWGDPGGSDAVAIRVVLHLLNRLRRLEKRVRQLEGD